MSHNCVLCKVLFCELCFCGAEAEQKPNMPFSGKMCVRPNALFSRKYRLLFRSETEKRTSGASGTAKRRSNACKAVGRRVAKAGGAMPRTSGASGERREASESETTEPSSQQLSRREVQSLCSLFAFLGGSNAPHWRRDGKETERNGGRIVFCLSFVHEYGDYF